MIFRAFHQEKKEFWGGKYYELHLQVILSSDEERKAEREGLMKKPIIGGNLEIQHLNFLCGKKQISMLDLVCGLTATVNESSQKEQLILLKKKAKKGCKIFQSYLKENLDDAGKKKDKELFTLEGTTEEEEI